jgi:hypothetical protein
MMWETCEIPVTEGRSKRKVGRPRRPVPAGHVHELRRRGLSFREIAREIGFGYGSVRRAYLSSIELDTASLSPTGAGEQWPRTD